MYWSFFMLHWQALIVTAVIPIVWPNFSKNLPAPPKHYGTFDVLPIRKVFAKAKSWGDTRKAYSDWVPPQSKQILAKIFQVRPIPYQSSNFVNNFVSKFVRIEVRKTHLIFFHYYVKQINATHLMMMCSLDYKFQFDITWNTKTELTICKMISFFFLSALMEH